MIKEKTYKFNFNINNIKKLRETVNNNFNSLYNNKISVNKSNFIWDKLCVVLDRLEHTLEYLNNIKLINKYHHSTEGINPRDSRPVVIIENSGTKDDLVKKIISIINESSSQNYDNSESSM